MSHDPFLNQSQDHGSPQMPMLKAGQRLFNRRYELLRVLGAGGMGVVWLAHDHTEEIDVALKFLPSVLVLQDSEMRRLKDEVRAGKELRHPRLVATYGMEIEDGIAAIIMEFVPGQTLLQKLEGQPRGFFEPEEIMSWVRDMTDGLAYLHDEARRIHRDLKPANVMIDANGRARLMDFGISHRIKEGVSRHSKTNEGAAGASSSTLAYASPQQITGKPSAQADDLYSLGATVYELLTGTPPFFRGGIDAVRGQIKDEPPTPIMERRQELVDEGLNRDVGQMVRGDFAQAVMDCLAKERERRPASPHVLHAVSTASASRPPAAADDAEARKRAALDSTRKEEERQMAEERKRAAEAAAQMQPKAAEADTAAPPPPPTDDVYAEYLSAAPAGAVRLNLAYLPVSPRGAWQDRQREAEKNRWFASMPRQAASSSVAAFAFVQRRRFNHGMILCCELRPDHVCCSWLEIEHGVYEELATWTIVNRGLTPSHLASRIQASCAAMREHTHLDPARIEGWAITHSCSATCALARSLAEKAPGTVWLWEEDLPAALAGAESGPHHTESLLLSVTPFALKVRLPDQSLLPLVDRFSTLPKERMLDLVWSRSQDIDLSSARLEIVEETDHGAVPVKSQAVARSHVLVQNGRVRTLLKVDIDASWQMSVQVVAPEGAPATKAAEPQPAKAQAARTPPPAPPPAPASAPAAVATPDKLLSSTWDRVATLLSVVLIGGSFLAALALRPDWDHWALWRNGCWLLLLAMLFACGCEKDGSTKMAQRLVMPVIVTFVSALLFTLAAWLWPGKTTAKLPGTEESRFSENKVFTTPSSSSSGTYEPPGEAKAEPMR